MNTRLLKYGWVLAAAIFAAQIPTPATASSWLTKANFYGFFHETNGVWEQSAGLITISTTDQGRYSVKISMDGKSYSWSGAFDSSGQVSKDILRRYDDPLHVEFGFDSQNSDLITGTVSSGDWVAPLYADRAVFDGRYHVCTDWGQYTMIVPGDFTSTNTPGGATYGTITVSKAGRLSFAGRLADGTSVAQSSYVSQDGLWPLYLSLYRGYGALYSWMQFNGSTNEQLSGAVSWLKSAQPWTSYYPRGFGVDVQAYGSRYTRPPQGTSILDLPSAQLEFNGGNLRNSFTNLVALNTKSQVINFSANRLYLSFSLSNGSFSGKVQDPSTWDWIPIYGVVLQFYNIAAGSFPGWNQSGEVWLETR